MGISIHTDPMRRKYRDGGCSSDQSDGHSAGRNDRSRGGDQCSCSCQMPKHELPTLGIRGRFHRGLPPPAVHAQHDRRLDDARRSVALVAPPRPKCPVRVRFRCVRSHYRSRQYRSTKRSRDCMRQVPGAPIRASAYAPVPQPKGTDARTSRYGGGSIPRSRR
jgi:hypothetical protein